MTLGTNGIYMGDRWRPEKLGSSRYMWFPLSWATGVPQIVQADVWTLNLAAGMYSPLFPGYTYLCSCQEHTPWLLELHTKRKAELSRVLPLFRLILRSLAARRLVSLVRSLVHHVDKLLIKLV